MKIWTLIVQSDFQACGRPFSFDIESSLNVHQMKEKVKEERTDVLAHVDAADITVWKTTGEMTLIASDKGWEEIFKKIDVNDENTIEDLPEAQVVANLGLSESQILLVQMMDDGPTDSPTDSPIDSPTDSTMESPGHYGSWRYSRNQQLLTSLRESIVNKPPYISGTLRLPDSFFSLFYKVDKDGHAARHINFSDATPDELEQLAQACEPASFGVHHEQVLDESYRKAGKMDSECFVSTLDLVRTDLVNIIHDCLLEGTQSTKNIKAELYKLNVYGTGSFFKPHVDTPRSEKMFGSLVVVFPTFHEGGALLLRHRGHEWIFDSGQALTGAANNQLSIGYVAFFSDIEHEVALVTSGHRVTLTYNLYFDDRGPVSEKDAVSEHLVPPQLPNQEIFRKAFERLLEDAEFMAEGGTLGFGLRHVYPIERDLKHVHNVLKGSDAVVYQGVRALGFEPVLYVYYDDTFSGNSPPTGVIVDQLSGLGEAYEETITQVLQDDYGGIPVRQDGGESFEDEDCYHSGNTEMVEWVTPVTVYNRQKGAYVYLGNEASLGYAYGDVCMMVRIGKAGDRLGYPTVAQVKKVYQRGRDERGYY